MRSFKNTFQRCQLTAIERCSCAEKQSVPFVRTQKCVRWKSHCLLFNPGIGNLQLRSYTRLFRSSQGDSLDFTKHELLIGTWLIWELSWLQFSLCPCEVAWKIKRHQHFVAPRRLYVLEDETEWLFCKKVFDPWFKLVVCSAFKKI